MLVRLITAAVLVPVVMTLAWVPSLRLGFSIFIACFATIGLYEYYAIVRAREISPETIGGMFSGTIVALSGHWGLPMATNLTLYGGLLLVSALHIVRGQHSVAGLASSAFGVFYVGWLAAHVTLLRAVPQQGAGLFTLLFVGVFLTDCAAYIFGTWLGKHKLAPKVSPKKSWEGAVAGFVFSLAGMVVLCLARRRWDWEALPDWSVAQYMLAGAILSITAQFGDLAESCLKRDAGVKDSGVIFPGHGGMLDRCDGLLFAAPVLYYMVTPLGLC